MRICTKTLILKVWMGFQVLIVGSREGDEKCSGYPRLIGIKCIFVSQNMCGVGEYVVVAFDIWMKFKAFSS